MTEHLTCCVYEGKPQIAFGSEFDETDVVRKLRLQVARVVALVTGYGEFAWRALDVEFDVVDKSVVTPEGQRPDAALALVGAFRNECVRKVQRLGELTHERPEEV